MTTKFDIEKMFSDPEPTNGQRDKIENVRAGAKVLARILLENVPDGYVQRNCIEECQRILRAATMSIVNQAT